MFITDSMSDFLYADDEHKLNIISVGVTLFIKNQSKTSTNSECIYRICQDGLRFITPSLGKRIVKTDCVESFKRLIMHHYHNLEDVPSAKLRDQVQKLSPGCFIVGYQMPGGKHLEAVTMHTFIASNMSTMISKENLYSLQMRHLTAEEREISLVAMQQTGS